MRGRCRPVALRAPARVGSVVSPANKEVLDRLDPTRSERARERLRERLVAHAREDGAWFDSRAWIVEGAPPMIRTGVEASAGIHIHEGRPAITFALIHGAEYLFSAEGEPPSPDPDSAVHPETRRLGQRRPRGDRCAKVPMNGVGQSPGVRLLRTTLRVQTPTSSIHPPK